MLRVCKLRYALATGLTYCIAHTAEAARGRLAAQRLRRHDIRLGRGGRHALRSAGPRIGWGSEALGTCGAQGNCCVCPRGRPICKVGADDFTSADRRAASSCAHGVRTALLVPRCLAVRHIERLEGWKQRRGRGDGGAPVVRLRYATCAVGPARSKARAAEPAIAARSGQMTATPATRRAGLDVLAVVGGFGVKAGSPSSLRRGATVGGTAVATSTVFPTGVQGRCPPRNSNRSFRASSSSIPKPRTTPSQSSEASTSLASCTRSIARISHKLRPIA